MTKFSSSPRNSTNIKPAISPSPSLSHSSSSTPSPKTACMDLEQCKSITYFRSRIDGVCAYYISTEEELRLASHILRQWGNNIVSLDLEGVHLSKTGPISLLHLYDGKAIFIIDVLKLKNVIFRHGCYIREILTSTTVTKIMFDCRKDCEALFHQYGVVLDNVIDVQMAEIIYRYKIIRDVPRYFIGLASAVEQYNILKGTDSFESYANVRNVALGKYSPARGGKMEVWGERPLDLDLLVYCAEDIKSIYRLYTKVFAKKLSYETCIGVSLIRLRETLMGEDTTAHAPSASSCSPRSHTTASPVKCYVNFDVEVFSKFEDSMQQYRKMGFLNMSLSGSKSMIEAESAEPCESPNIISVDLCIASAELSINAELEEPIIALACGVATC